MNGFANATYIIGKKVVKTSEIRYNEAVKLILNFEKRGQNNVTNYSGQKPFLLKFDNSSNFFLFLGFYNWIGLIPLASVIKTEN